MTWPRVTPHETSVEIATEAGRLLVDGSQGMLVVDPPEHEIWELGASRAGVGAALGLARDTLQLGRLLSDDVRTLGEAITGCLRRGAARAAQRLGSIEHQINQLRPTPLLYSHPLLTTPYLRDDAERFRPCRIAIAHFEADDDDDHTPERAEWLVERLGSWRALFTPDGKIKRALTATLADFGDQASVYALWGLRNVPLARRVPSLEHLEVLGALGQHPCALRLRAQMGIVQATTPEQLHQCLELLPVTLGMPAGVTPAHALGEAIAGITVPVRDLRELRLIDLITMVEELRDTARDPATWTVLPPIPLPEGPGLRFLRTVGEVWREGQTMQHCVGSRASLAVNGRAFFFHAEDGCGDAATVQVDLDGRVVEARGPANHATPAATFAARALAAWGRGFWFAHLGMRTALWRHGRAAPARAEPLNHVDACFREYRRACALMPDDDGELLAWYQRVIPRAINGELWLVLARADEVAVVKGRQETWPAVRAIDDKGRIVESTMEVHGRRQNGFLPVVRVGAELG